MCLLVGGLLERIILRREKQELHRKRLEKHVNEGDSSRDSEKEEDIEAQTGEAENSAQSSEAAKQPGQSSAEREEANLSKQARKQSLSLTTSEKEFLRLQQDGVLHARDETTAGGNNGSSFKHTSGTKSLGTALLRSAAVASHWRNKHLLPAFTALLVLYFSMWTAYSMDVFLSSLPWLATDHYW